jgi:hypothetical protein
MPDEARLTIHFTDGTHLTLRYPQSERTDPALGSRIEALLDHQYFLVEVEGSVMLFPFTNIKYIQAHPAPNPLPQNIIRGARIED